MVKTIIANQSLFDILNQDAKLFLVENENNVCLLMMKLGQIITDRIYSKQIMPK